MASQFTATILHGDTRKPTSANRHAVWYSVLLVFLCICIFGCEREEVTETKQTEFEIDRAYEKGPLSVHVKIDKEQISIADTLRLRLEATIEEGYQITMPRVGDLLDQYEFALMDYQAPPDKLIENNRLLVQREYVLEPMFSGAYSTPALTFVFTEQPGGIEEAGDDKTKASEKHYELHTEAIPVEVTSLLDEDRDDLEIADIKDVVPLPSRWPLWWIWLVIAAAVLVMAVIILVRRRRQKKRYVRILKAAHELAYESLRKLQEDDLVAQQRVKEFYERISHIVRRYIEHRFELPAPQHTTEEFLIEAGSAEYLTAEQKAMLRQFLQHCDMVKFARYGPTPEEIAETFGVTEEFIEATRQDECRVDVTEQIPDQPTSAARNV